VGDRLRTRAVALVRPENLPSIRAAQELGMTPEETAMVAEQADPVLAMDRHSWPGREAPRRKGDLS